MHQLNNNSKQQRVNTKQHLLRRISATSLAGSEGSGWDGQSVVIGRCVVELVVVVESELAEVVNDGEGEFPAVGGYTGCGTAA